MIVVEVKTAGIISVDGRQVDDLLDSLTAKSKCTSLIVLIDFEVEHQLVIEVLDITKKAGCENVTIKGVSST